MTHAPKTLLCFYTKLRIWTKVYGAGQAGFTLLEILIVIAIVGFLSTLGTYRFIAFQRDSQLSAFSEEFASSLKTAKNKSINGETYGTQYLSECPVDNLPYWGVSTTTSSYTLEEKCVRSNFSIYSEAVVVTNLQTGYSFSVVGANAFERLTGKMSGTASYILGTPGNSECAKVSIDSYGEVSITKSCS